MPAPLTSNLSVQLYTVREAVADDLFGTLARIAEIGYTQVEPYSFSTFPQLGEALAASGLVAPTTHQVFLRTSAAEQAEFFAAAQKLGIGTVIDPNFPDGWDSADGVAAAAAKLNAAAAIAADYGVRIGYHNHAHEIRPRYDGRAALEVLADQLDPGIGLEVDAYWAAAGGEDPVALLQRLGDRVIAVHVKDGHGVSDTMDQVAVGSGDQPIAEILAASPQALHVVELDDCRTDRFQAIADSFTFLNGGGAA